MSVAVSDIQGEIAPLKHPDKLSFFAFPIIEKEFTLDEEFIDLYRGKQPDWGPIGYVTYSRSYSRAKEDGKQEEFWETCRRVVEGTYRIQQRHCQLYHLHFDLDKAQRSARKMYDLMWNFKFLPPGRGLWAMGSPAMEKVGSTALLNCAFISTKTVDQDFSGPFVYLMDMSMLGVGVGGDCRGRGKITLQEPRLSTDTHVVEDSREGWVEAVKRVLDAYAGIGSLPTKWDYSQIRPKGAPIKTFGGLAPGPEPLRLLLEEELPLVLNKAVRQPLSSETIVDLYTTIGKCVVSGGIRRTAILMLGDHNDAEFKNLKDPVTNQEALTRNRWAANNSIFAEVGMDYSDAALQLAKNGEPGLVWLDVTRKHGRMADEPDSKDAQVMGFNPCVEEPLFDGEACCLVETFISRHDTYEEYEETLKYAYLYGKTVSILPTHNKVANQVQLRNRRIGTSQSGIVQAIQKIGKDAYISWCNRGYNYLRKLDAQYSNEWLCVRESIRITTIKPSGSVSLLPQVTPGIHHPISEYYIRRVRIAEQSKLVDPLTNAGYYSEYCAYSPNTLVFEFPVKEENFSKAESELTLDEQMELTAIAQKYWADNGVSVTVKFSKKDGEEKAAKEIEAVLNKYEGQLKAVSFLPTEDHGYAQAPYEPISKEKYEELIAKVKPLELNGEAENEVQDAFCTGDRCIIPVTQA